MNSRLFNWILTCVIILHGLSPNVVYADTTAKDEEEAIQIGAVSAILIDQDTGRVLYEKNADEELYPASMTKIMTALLCVENIKPDEIVEVGTEINYTPWDSSRAGLEVGESITGENLIRSLIIPSGNEAANTVALEVVKRKTGNNDISYPEAEKQFAAMMNERAASLGATNTNFVTPSGYHDDAHKTTARDLALISTKAMQNETIKKIAAEVSFTGPSVETGVTEDMKVVTHSWYTHNQIINPKNPYYYRNATGLKTGFTDLAGECLVGTATVDDTNLLLVLFNSPDPQRWIDAKLLFDYGFTNYSKIELQTEGSVIQEVLIDNPVKGTSEFLNVLANDNATALLADDEIEQVIHTIEFNPTFLSENYTETGSPQIKAPILAGQEIGTIKYMIGDELLYEGPVISDVDVNQRTIFTDIKFYSEKLKDFVLSWRIIPITAAVLFSSIYIVRGLKKRKVKKRKKVKYKSKYNNFKTRY